MPIKIPDKLPATRILRSENIFVMTETRAIHQDIRPLKILILNLMPTKITTETQLLRLLGNTPIQIEPELIYTSSYRSKNTPMEHLQTFYSTFEKVRQNKYDGMIITGAPVEHLNFEEVTYWEELKEIMEWSKHNVTSTMHICWAAQAGLYYHYGIPKHDLHKKTFGVFIHTVDKPKTPLLRGFDDYFYAPHSRHSEVWASDIKKVKQLEILASSKEAGVYIVATKDGRQIFITGHAEYDSDTLNLEYLRDKEKGLDIDIPENYYKYDNPANPPIVRWRAHAHLLFSNWLNYYVYQQTPYDIQKIK